MAVYTPLSAAQVEGALADYDIGALLSCQDIAEGVENSNFLVTTTRGRFILTLFEKRMNPAELPWFLGLMETLAQAGVVVPRPLPNRHGEVLGRLRGKPAVIVTFLEGASLPLPEVWACEALGRGLAELHEAGGHFTPARPNQLGPNAWGGLLAQCHGGTAESYGASGGEEVWLTGLRQEGAAALERILPRWPDPDALPQGQIHADIFPDNVFFLPEERRLSGMIDFYFACTDFLAYDLAIVLNAWCFEDGADGHVQFVPEKAAALLRGYETRRALDEAEWAALPILCQGAALRFMLTRLYDWLHTPPAALVTRKNPEDYARRLRFFADNPACFAPG